MVHSTFILKILKFTALKKNTLGHNHFKFRNTTRPEIEKKLFLRTPLDNYSFFICSQSKVPSFFFLMNNLCDTDSQELCTYLF